MTSITFDQAKEFLDNITDKDNIAIIHHDDLDGFASGIIFCDWCKQKGAEIENFIFKFGGWNKETNLEKFNKIIITDIAPNGISELSFPKDKEIFYTDHHPKDSPIPKEMLELRLEGYLPSSRIAGRLTKLKPWLALAGTIADAGDLYPENEKYLKENLEKYNSTLEEYSEKIVQVISNTLVFFDRDLQKAFEIIKEINSIEEIIKLKKYSDKVEEEIEEQLKNIENNSEKIKNLHIIIVNPKYPIRGILINKVSRTNPKKIFIFLSPKKENPELLGISSRHQSDKADLPSLLKAGIKGLENANAGGHKRAAGGQIQTKDLEKFKENLKNFVEQLVL